MDDLTQAGKSITFNYTFNYTGHTEAVNLLPGKYKLECWGARGGYEESIISYSGKGGYSTGVITLQESTTLYINVGQCPGLSWQGGWNGGGSTGWRYAGGGASDISLKGTYGTTSWNTPEHLYSRIIVAGGGGGIGGDGYTFAGGYGGGLTGGDGAGDSYGGGGTQTSAGIVYDNSYGAAYGGFGYGAWPTATNGERVGAGGGGWYGGSCGGYHDHNGSGGGGSGYVYTQSTASNYPPGCLLSPEYYLEDASTIANANNQDHGKVVITCHAVFIRDAIVRNFIQNVDLSYTQYGDDREMDFDYYTFVPDTFTGMTLARTNVLYKDGLLHVDCYYTRNAYTLTLNYGTSRKYSYLYEEQGNIHYDRRPIDSLHKFKNWVSDVPANIDLAYLYDTTFKMPASDLTISVEFTDQDRVNTNIYKNIFDSFLFDLYDFQTIFNDPYKQETATFQYNHGFQVYDLLRLNQNGLYEKGIATESKYDVIGMVTEVLNDHEFVLTTYGQIKTNINFDSDSGILYLSDTQEGKFCSYEELASNFYTPIGFYTGNTITLNILDSSVGEVLKKYHDTIYEYEQSLPYITEAEKQDIIQEVLNNA